MPAKRSNPKTMHRAGELRKEPTPAERKLWLYLRGNKLSGISFRRQHAIGNYIPDFVSIKRKIIIELDAVSIWSKPAMISSEVDVSNRWDTR